MSANQEDTGLPPTEPTEGQVTNPPNPISAQQVEADAAKRADPPNVILARVEVIEMVVETEGEDPVPHKVLRPVPPITENGNVNAGAFTTIKLPSAAEQAQGFYLPPDQASVLLMLYPQIYKSFLTGGQSRQAQGQQEGGQS